MPTLLTRTNRTGRVVSATTPIPAGSTGTLEIMSNIGAADLADATKFIVMQIDVQDATQPGGWLLLGGGGVTFQCGPTRLRDGTTNAAGANRGFSVNAAELAGKTVRGVIEIHDGAIDGPFGSASIGVTYTIS